MSELDLMQIARIITPNYLMGDVLQLGEADHDFEKSILVKALNELQKIRTGLCPRQVLGVRPGMLAGRLLNLGLPQMD